jgi:glycine/serine hydroxymethyltransferase
MSPVERAQEIAERQELPGPEGAFWRLMALMDHQNITRWVEGEKVRRIVTPDELGNIISQVIAGTVVQAVGHTVAPAVAREFARQIMSNAVPMVEADLTELVKRASKTAIHAGGNVSRIPPRLRIVKP